MLINLSNHPSARWPEEQLKAAVNLFGDVIDLPFPNIDPEWDTDRVAALAGEYAGRCNGMLTGEDNHAVHIMGELTFTHHFVNHAKTLEIHCVASTTSREVRTNDAGEKVSTFKFVKFRNY
jgi:hypothetical protein